MVAQQLSGLQFLILFKSPDDMKQNFVFIEKEIKDHIACSSIPILHPHLPNPTFSALPSTFGHAFKQLRTSLLTPFEGMTDNKMTSKLWIVNSKSEVWKFFKLQGLIDHYENILASVEY